MQSWTHQLINEPAHLFDSSSSCIDLIFTFQPNLVMESGVQPSLHPNCHHQFLFSKFDLSIYFPPPYERTLWYYIRANADLIRKAIDLFDWVSHYVLMMWTNKVTLVQNFVSNETITCDDRDPP